MTLLDRVKNLCNDNSITLSKLEKTLGFGNGTLSRWDDSSPSGDKLSKVANFFNVSIDYLIGNINYIKIGITIRNKRNVNKISVSEVAHRLGISNDEYVGIEKGTFEPPIKVYGDICNLFDFMIYELFSLQPDFENIDKKTYDSLDDSAKAEYNKKALNNKKFEIDGKSNNVIFTERNEFEKEINNKSFFIDICNLIGFACSEYNYKKIPGFIVNNKDKKLFITRDNAYLLIENIKDFFFMKLGNTLCYSEEILDDESIFQDNIRMQLNAAHADGEPSEEDIKKTNEIMDNDENWD